MKKNKMLKIVSFFVMIMLIITSFSFATSIIPSNEEVDPELPDENVSNIANGIIGRMKWIGYVIAIGMLIYVGARYILASADEKASMKGLLVKVAIGSGIIVGANAIVNLVIDLAGA